MLRFTSKPGIRRRIAMLTTSLAMVGGVQAVAIVPATHASVPASCTWGDIYYEIGTQSRPINITHEKYISLAPHTSYSKSTTLSLTLNFAVKVTGSVSGTVEANAILGRAAATAGLSVELSGSITGTGTFTDTFSASNTTSVQKHFIFYQGVRELTGTWTKWQCDRWENYSIKVSSGTYATFWDEPSGTVMCEATTGLDAMDKLAKSKYC